MSRERTSLSILAGLCILPALAAGPAAPPADDLAALRQRLEQETSRERWDVAARRLLAALDAAGAAHGPEAAWIVSKLLETHPDDPILLWRRGEMRRRGGDLNGAIADFEQLARAHADHPAGIRARRALPALYLRAGLAAKSVRADEALLRDRLADPLPVLARLARSYAQLGQPADVRQTLERLEAISPDRAQYDPALGWLAAEASGQLDPPLVAAAGYLRFANIFPDDLHHAEALMRAAEIFAEHGRHGLAATLAEEVAATAREADLAARAQLLRGAAFERRKELDAARTAYREGLDRATSPQLAAEALRRLVDLTIREQGSEAALLMLAAEIRVGGRFRRKLAEVHFPRLLEAVAGKIARDPAKAHFFRRLLQELELEQDTPPEIALGAAELLERVGAEEEAGRIYARLVSEAPAPLANRAREGLARCAPDGLAQTLPAAAHLRALARKQRWDAILALLPQVPAGDPAAAAVAAHAAMRAGRPEEARGLLRDLPDAAPPEARLLRGDLRALGGAFARACEDYRAAGRGRLPLVSEQAWLELRLAACAWQEEKPAEARRRLEKLLARSPDEPVRFAAEDLLSRVGTAAPGHRGAS